MYICWFINLLEPMKIHNFLHRLLVLRTLVHVFWISLSFVCGQISLSPWLLWVGTGFVFELCR